MKITICSSMAFSEKVLDVKKLLEMSGHEVFVSEFIDSYVGKDEKSKQALTIFHKNTKDAIREHWNKIKNSDAILVLNYDRKGIENYIGGNTLMEIGFAHVLDKKIFLLNPIPEIEYYKSEIEAIQPIILHGDLSKMV